MLHIRKNISTFLILISSIAGLQGQVTIGSGERPVEGALLDLKENSNIDGSPTSSKGMILPRVSLTDANNLFPMFEAGSEEYTAENKAAQDALHTGLTVYNTNQSQTLNRGIYVWNGKEWEPSNPGPWYRIDSPDLPSSNPNTDSYLNAAAVVGGTTAATGATLTVHGSAVIGDTVSASSESAILDIQSANKGVLIPRVRLLGQTDRTTILNPEKGLMVYNTNPNMPEGVGLYTNYGTKQSPEWTAFVNFSENHEENDRTYELISTVFTSNPSGIEFSAPADSISSRPIPDMQVTVIVPPHSENIVNVTYSLSAGMTTSTSAEHVWGYIGINLMKNGAEIPSGFQKITIENPGSAQVRWYYYVKSLQKDFMETIVNNSPDPQTVTYSLNAYVENTGTLPISVFFGTPDDNPENNRVERRVVNRVETIVPIGIRPVVVGLGQARGSMIAQLSTRPI